jgi:mRNA-degrading endonuclease RelE of RelBE toxin-antitoxin system
VAKYSLEIKQSAQKELDALDETLFARIDRKILALADNRRGSVAGQHRFGTRCDVRLGDEPARPAGLLTVIPSALY